MPPFCQLARTVKHLSFGSWPTFPLNLVRVCESIWKLCTFLQKATSIATPPFTGINLNTHLHTHTWPPCQISASWGKNCGHQRVGERVGNSCGPTADIVTELLISAKNDVFTIFLSRCNKIPWLRVLQLANIALSCKSCVKLPPKAKLTPTHFGKF